MVDQYSYTVLTVPIEMEDAPTFSLQTPKPEKDASVEVDGETTEKTPATEDATNLEVKKELDTADKVEADGPAPDFIPSRLA
jgi:hypothetical protein